MAQLTFPFSLHETFSHCDSTLLSLLNQQTFWKNCRKLFIPINLVCVSIEEIRGSIVDRSVRREMELDALNGKRLDAVSATLLPRAEKARAGFSWYRRGCLLHLLLLLLLSLSPAYVTPGPHDFHWNRASCPDNDRFTWRPQSSFEGIAVITASGFDLALPDNDRFSSSNWTEISLVWFQRR